MAARSIIRLRYMCEQGLSLLRKQGVSHFIRTSKRCFYTETRKSVNMRRVAACLGVIGGVGIGAIYSFSSLQEASELSISEISTREEEETSKIPSVTLYQYYTCPFCCKVKAFFDYYGIEYSIVEVNPLSKKELKFSKSYRKVPIAIVNGKQINDSSVITSVLKSYLLGEQNLDTLMTYYPEMKSTNEEGKEVTEYANRHAIMHMTGVGKSKQKSLMEERQWRKWVDNVFVHTLSPNIYRTTAEASKAFEYFSTVGNFSTVERYAVRYCGSVFMYMLGKHLKHRHKLKDDVRLSLYEEGEKWMKAVGNRKFMGGSSPNLADLAVYGVLSGLEELDMFKDLMDNTTMKPWYERVRKAVKAHEGAKMYDQNTLKGL